MSSLLHQFGIPSSSSNNHGEGKSPTTMAASTVASTAHHEEDKMIGMDVETGSGLNSSMPVVTEDDCAPQDDNASTTSSTNSKQDAARKFASRTNLIAALILLVGAGASALILGAGIRSAHRDQESQFQSMSLDLMRTFETAIKDYVTAGLWIHQACVSRRDTMTHQEFRVVYEYIISTGLELQAITFAMNVTSPEERESVENRTRLYLQEDYPDLNYIGFKGFTEDGPGPLGEDAKPYYYSAHFVEPMEDPKNQFALDFDISTSPVRRIAVEEAVATGQPAMTTRLKLIQEGEEGTESYAYSTIIMHPGIPLSNSTPAAARKQVGDATLVVIRIPEVLIRARQNLNMKQHASLYIFDSTNKEEAPEFLGGAKFLSDDQIRQEPEGQGVEFRNELELQDLQSSSYQYLHERRIPIASREWTFVVAAYDTYSPSIAYVILGASLVFLACVCLAMWILTNHKRMTMMNQIRAQADAEKAKLMVDSAKEAANKERELNDFLSHEVRNPISAAISACSFVESALQECRKKTIKDTDNVERMVVEEEDFQCIEEDVAIIDSSLSFVNDLLRNMLDMHRATNNQMKIEMEPVDLLRDVLEPVASILYQRGADFEVLLDCPENLIVMTDKLRLKQTALNLGRNATKFVSKGFVRLRACVVHKKVHLFIEDSGPGIPLQKRKQLFGQFQETLDSLSQGTGMGLSLCKKLVELMEGELSLDEAYDSGLPGSPGACFVVNLNTPPLSVDAFANDESCEDLLPARRESALDTQVPTCTCTGRQLPENLSILFCDDDWKLRTLFSRALKRVTTGWQIREASNGETALRLVDEETFDLIFMDQYFSSVVKQLLGTETVHSMRSRGVSSIICGLSANDVEKPFIQAGADCFVMKPLPTNTKDLTGLLFKLLDSRNARPRPSLLNRSSKPKNSQSQKPASSRSVSTKESSDGSLSFDLADALPKTLTVLLVDDDEQLRKLYNRSLRRIAPGWTIQEAPGGEAALDMTTRATQPDVIFIDMYMPHSGKEKPLLGTETARLLRQKGVTSIICGLSANNVKREFLAAGADCFQMKPFPCEKVELTRELVRILAATPDLPSAAPPSVLPKGQPNPPPPAPPALPSSISILFVDDSSTIRKMFSRCVKRATTVFDWTVDEADCGESALQMVESRSFDIIFLDQNTNTALSGTDTARLLREKGVKSLIVGCSGDAIETQFLEAGADRFWLKPFPCEKDQLVAALTDILRSKVPEIAA